MTEHQAPTQQPERIVVATDGTPAGNIGIQFATREAQRLGLGIELVHVVPAYIPAGSFPMIPDDSMNQYGREVLTRGTDVAREVDPDIELTTSLMRGGRAGTIVSRAHDAALIVLGSHPLTVAERFWTGATVPGVAARSSCPVVTVPADYDANRHLGRVIVGVKEPSRSADLLASAFAVAKDLHAELVVIHAWKLAAGYDDLVSNEVAREEWRVELEAAIEKELVDLRQAHPDVSVRVEIVHGMAAEALISASRDADRLIITRPVHGGYFHHLGSTARAILRDAHCPVEIFPPTNTPSAEDLELELEQANFRALLFS